MSQPASLEQVVAAFASAPLTLPETVRAAGRRSMLNMVGTAIGGNAAPIDVNLDAPLYVAAGTYLHVILRMPVATATAAQIIRGLVLINGYYE